MFDHCLTRLDVEADPILTVKQVAVLLKVSEKTVYSMAKKGELLAFRVGNQWRFRREDIEDWIRSQSKKSIERTQTGLELHGPPLKSLE